MYSIGNHLGLYRDSAADRISTPVVLACCVERSGPSRQNQHWSACSGRNLRFHSPTVKVVGVRRLDPGNMGSIMNGIGFCLGLCSLRYKSIEAWATNIRKYFG